MAVVYLVTRINSISGALFHVEHSAGQRWFFRWRIRGEYPEAYLAWREGSCSDPLELIHPEISGSELEVEWRASPEQPWSQAALRDCGTGTARFWVRAEHDFVSRQPFRVMADVGGRVACYIFDPLELYAGVETVVVGTADGPFPENVLLHPGDFKAGDAVVRFENLGGSEGSLVAPSDPLPRLAVIPGAAQRRLYALSPARRQQSSPSPDHG